MTDLERFFVQLVRTLAAQDPALLGKPLFLADIRKSILPYRASRRALQLESSEDYELVLMRLCAGEGEFARTGPDEVGDEFRSEVRSPNPDLTLAERHENAVVHLDPTAVAQVLDQKSELAYAPRQPRPQPPEPQPEPPDTLPRCPRCGDPLPGGRTVNFCPQCGHNLARARCPQCRAELEPGWRHCIACGTAVPGSNFP